MFPIRICKVSYKASYRMGPIIDLIALLVKSLGILCSNLKKVAKHFS